MGNMTLQWKYVNICESENASTSLENLVESRLPLLLELCWFKLSCLDLELSSGFCADASFSVPAERNR